MITINGYKFAETEKEFIDSLFHSDGTCYGYAKRTKRAIKFYNQQHEIFGAINQESVVASSRKLDNGKTWYSYGTPEIFGELSLSDERSLGNDLSIGRDHIGLIFK